MNGGGGDLAAARGVQRDLLSIAMLCIAHRSARREMHPAVLEKRTQIELACRRNSVARLDVFGSAARASDFQPGRSDVDFLVEFENQGSRIRFSRSRRRSSTSLSVRWISSIVEPSKGVETTSGGRTSSPTWKPSSLRDEALLLDIVNAAEDARSFVDGMNWSAFGSSRLHQNAVIRSLEVIGEAAANSRTSSGRTTRRWIGLT